MLRKFLVGLSVIAALAGIAFLFREELFVRLLALRIAPEHSFNADLLPAAPVYTEDEHWAALPSSDDPSDAAPEGAGQDDSARVGVFFVHPTTYFGKDSWNQPLGDESANWITDQRVLRNQASVFNGCCEVFAPRYRQATFYSFIDDEGNGEQALQVAYSDVLAAFQNFLRRNGDRPFILAGHSQGARHTAQLLREEIAGTALQGRLVAAYPVGFSIEAGQVGGLPVCDSPQATGCVLAWNATDGEGPGLYPDAKSLICVNPLTWRADGGHGANTLNVGGIGFPEYVGSTEGEDVTAMHMAPAVADARCVDGHLYITDLRSDDFASRLPGNSLHLYDYGLYYMNIRENARERVNNYIRHASTARATGGNKR